MASLANTSIKDTYSDLISIYGGTPGEGLTTSYKRLFDGDGTMSNLFLSSLGTKLTGLTTVQGSFVLTNQNPLAFNTAPDQGELAFINNNLYIGIE
tara:strand:- start:2902 stop:3189 length:288 start_codon:yes stop_codon:yes gene_type:complete